ncbi:GPI inositol-deacylase [Psilocybe cubensis]|uniref:GPI inositol-deacylase n=2 Tax=Psilocybe cubensis TaxID=181762 RepID=A0ACB8H569_PSICU|nr:GPI inositol-deacylase [Psilocybe cubensis]KAH9482359.1 GPI inositol-deacylase [Psilocybe cubensis]
MSKIVRFFLGTSSLVAVLFFYLAGSGIPKTLSPQGCRMSWMSPSYVLQNHFNSSWSPLAHRYSLWLYREVAWDPIQSEGVRQGSLPVLFIPGNAGSSRQIRSIASSASKQYFSAPHIISPVFITRPLKPLDFYAVEFNEDLSAFHGSTLESQVTYTKAAIKYILSLYPPKTSVIVMGHSMGGIVATALLPSDEISAVITMSTPHTLPPARFDSRIDDLYQMLQRTLEEDHTPIVSICGGAADLMIPSESCILPMARKDIFRRTVFSSALEGAWTGVGHQAMVWCHQVRWRVARAALELGAAKSLEARAIVLDTWLRNGHSPPTIARVDGEFEVLLKDTTSLPIGKQLVLKNPNTMKTYLLPVSEDSFFAQKLTLLVSRGTIAPVSPQKAVALTVDVSTCSKSITSVQCVPLQPETLKLIPNPVPGVEFPASEGADESEGVVLFEAFVPRRSNHHWIGIEVKNADGRGWVNAGLDSIKPNIIEANTWSLLTRSISISIPNHEGLSVSYTFPNILSNALVVYRIVPKRITMPSCTEALMPPLLMHTSGTEETHYFSLAQVPNKRILLHTHTAAPFIDISRHPPSVLNFTIYSSAEPDCRDEFSSFNLDIDWFATMGRWASRYLTTLVAWSAGVATIIIFLAWSQQESDPNGLIPGIGESISLYTRLLFRFLLPGSFFLATLPLPVMLYLGNNGTFFLTLLAPLLLFVASGTVCVSWWLLCVLLAITGKVGVFVFGSRRENVGVPGTTLLSLAIICAAIFLFIPWQVAYLGCWVLHLYTCASLIQQQANLEHHTDAVPLVDRSGRQDAIEYQGDRTLDLRQKKNNNLNLNIHILLLMTWLLPLTAPVLAVWVRTLLSAGYTTPFDGDHNFVAVLPFLMFADFASRTPGQIFDRRSFERRVSFRWLFVALAGTAFLFGSRRPYLILDCGRIVVWILVICKIGPRYWGGSPWKFG